MEADKQFKKAIDVKIELKTSQYLVGDNKYFSGWILLKFNGTDTFDWLNTCVDFVKRVKNKYSWIDFKYRLIMKNGRNVNDHQIVDYLN